MNNVLSEIKELEIEKILWGIVIFLAALNIYGDNIQEMFLRSNNKELEQKAKQIFIFTIAISILIYLYYVYRNYKEVQESEQTNQNILLHNIRLAGSILIVIGALFVLYFEVNEQSPIGTPVI